MATEKKGRKSLNNYMCESVYTAIAVNLHKHKSTRQAILWFIDQSDTFKSLASGDLHNKIIQDCENNTADKLLNYQDRSMHNPDDMKEEMIELGYYCYEPESGEPFTKEDVEGMKVERDRIILEIGRVKSTGDQGDTSTGFSDKAYKQIWRMCETYEKYCLATDFKYGGGPLPLNIVKNN
tara:strand:+ start:104 stop:643 length:540 start_codon:yes stop_codon:yes gene_type:complete